jgi:hypothetical protein
MVDGQNLYLVLAGQSGNDAIRPLDDLTHGSALKFRNHSTRLREFLS